MPFKDRKDAREKARLGGLASAAKRKLKGTAPAPYAGGFSTFLKDAGFTGPSWSSWRCLWRVVSGSPLSEDDRATFTRCTGRQRVPAGPLRELWIVAGRRGGKSRNLAARAVWEAIRRDYTSLLAEGERAVCALVAADRRQAAVVLRYVQGLSRRPALAPFLKRTLKDTVEFRTGCDVAVLTASHCTVRGYSLAGVFADEVSFWTTDELGASPDTEVLAALRPGLANIPGSLLVAASTPYARRGELWLTYQRAFGQDALDGVLVWRAPSLEMNPSLDAQVIAEARERDPAAAGAEWDAEFRSDVQGFLDLGAVRGVTVQDRRELPRAPGVSYRAFADPSGGSVDSFTLAIAHLDKGERAVLDVLREARPPFSPDSVVAEFAALLKSYQLSAVTGDHYSGEWVRERFLQHGIQYQPSARTKSDIYRELLPLVNQGAVELLDVPRLTAQLCGLERRVARGGKDSIDHGPGGHDDCANACAGALVLVQGARETQAWKSFEFIV